MRRTSLKLRFSLWLICTFALCLLPSQYVNGQDEGYLSEEALFEEDLDAPTQVSDPLEGLNRVIFRFNDYAYRYVARPVSSVYQLAPSSARQGVSHFFDNLRFPVRLTSNLLQARISGAWLETRRFAVNSTVGLFGVLDPASGMEGLEKIDNEDVGQALGSYGIGEGPYLVLPFMGPSNVRDLIGLLGDRSISPWVEPFSILDSEARMIYGMGEGVSRLPVYLELYDQMKGSAIDPYSSLKSAFMQYRRSAVKK
ncbi:MAG: VacJ family lipoprotein [Puniceicoccaceae bacterium MED-G30]|nr:MAG: VacJ family lipoprotein [Puniceicoccaceae bacterium MED-G30]